MGLDVRSMLKRMMVGNLDMGLFLVFRPNPQSFQKSSRKRNSEILTNSGFVDIHWGNERDIITVRGITASKIGNPNQYKKSEYLAANMSSYLNSFVSNSGTSSHGPKQWADVDRFMMKLEQIYKTDKERVGSLGDLLGDLKNTGSNLNNAGTKFLNAFKSEKNQTKINNKSDLLESIQNGTASRAQSFIIYDYTLYWGYFLTFNYSESATDKPRQYQYDFTFKVVNSSTDWISQSLISNFPEARILNFFSQLGENAEYVTSMLTSGDKLLKGIFI